MDDKACHVVIGGTEAGYCECMDYVQTSAVPCGHPPLKCNEMCGQVLKGQAHTFEKPGETHVETRMADHGKGPYERAQYYGEQAVDSVRMAKEAVDVGVADIKAKIAGLKTKPWQEVHDLGKDMEDAGNTAKTFAKVARPFLALH